MAAVEGVGPVAAENEHALGGEAGGEEGEEVAARAVGPVEVFEGEHDRRHGGEVGERGVEGLEESEAPEVAFGGDGVAGQERAEAGVAGDEVGVVAREGADDLGEGEVGQGGVGGVEAVAGDGEDTVTGAVVEFVEEPGLSDPRVAGDEHRGRSPRARGGECLAERGELAVAGEEGEIGT